MISVILIEPENPGNIGAIARVMKNFNFKDLILINPKCNHLSKEAQDRATHAKKILKKAKTKPISYLRGFDYIIATTAKLGTDFNIARQPISPKDLARKLEKINKNMKIGLMFGREGTGLRNKEILMSDFVVTINTSKEYPTMNISHAVAIVLYEIFQISKQKKINQHILFAKKKEKENILKLLNEILNRLNFKTESKKKTQVLVWKRVLNKAFLTKREAYAIFGFLRKLEKFK